jgi:hypothetical protein
LGAGFGAGLVSLRDITIILPHPRLTTRLGANLIPAAAAFSQTPPFRDQTLATSCGAALPAALPHPRSLARPIFQPREGPSDRCPVAEPPRSRRRRGGLRRGRRRPLATHPKHARRPASSAIPSRLWITYAEASPLSALTALPPEEAPHLLQTCKPCPPIRHWTFALACAPLARRHPPAAAMRQGGAQCA